MLVGVIVSKLKEEYTDVRNTYIGETYLVVYYFDVELVDKIISSLKKVKLLVLTVLQ